MDIRSTPPEEYAAWLRRCGVSEQDLPERMAHDVLRAMVCQMDETGMPQGFGCLKEKTEAMLAEDAMARTRL